MARPPKEGLEYFPMDVDIDQDDKLIVPIAKHGMLGFGVIVRMMMEIYRNGYYYPWTEKEQYVFPFKISTDKEKVCEIIGDCLESGFFHKEQYEKNQILTSYGFQKRFLLASNRRKDTQINEAFLVKKELLHTKTELMSTETPLMSAISTQKKLKEIKVNEIKKISCIFDHWKSEKLVNHRSLTPQIKNQITWKLATYSEEELASCITNYSAILHDPNYKLDTRWGLDTFFEKGHFEKFLPDRDPFNYYPKVKNELTPASKSKFERNKERLTGRSGVQGDGTRSEVHPIQSIGSLPPYRDIE